MILPVYCDALCLKKKKIQIKIQSTTLLALISVKALLKQDPHPPPKSVMDKIVIIKTASNHGANFNQISTFHHRITSLKLRLYRKQYRHNPLFTSAYKTTTTTKHPEITKVFPVTQRAMDSSRVFILQVWGNCGEMVAHTIFSPNIE